MRRPQVFYVTAYVTAITIVFVTVWVLWSGGAQVREGADRPNIILIMTDDQIAQTTRHMPNLQRFLVTEGINFSNAFASTPLCCPARVSLLRGQYPHNHGVLDNEGAKGGFPAFYGSGRERSTLATWLSGAGYRTALMGKYLNQYPFSARVEGLPRAAEGYVPPGWDEWYGFLDVFGVPAMSPYRMFDYRVNQNGVRTIYGEGEADYQTDVLRDLAVDFIDRAAADEAPFFLLLTPTAPHNPLIPAPRHAEAFATFEAPHPPTPSSAQRTRKPRWLRQKHDQQTAQHRATRDEINTLYRGQLRMLLAVDEMIGEIVETLQASGELANTLIIFTSDHGFHAGEQGLVALKRTPYNASVRVPLIVRGPGVPVGQTLPQLVLHTDLAPTLAALGGAEVPDFVDGRSLAPLLRGETSDWRRRVLLRHQPDAIVLTDVPAYRAVRSRRYLYVSYRYEDGSREQELYDLKQDPAQLDNIIADAPPALLRRLKANLERLSQCAGAACKEAEDAALAGG